MNCPHCLKPNRPGLLLCEHCGRQLITLSDLSRFKTARFSPGSMPILKSTEEIVPRLKTGASVLNKAPFVTLDLLDCEDSLRIKTQGHISLGRADADSDWLPTVDLSPFGAAERGVSRMHADLFFEDDQVYVLELGSANGTRINGTKVFMGQAQQIRDGDELQLGKMRIRVFFGD
jgi:hypothetical protein